MNSLLLLWHMLRYVFIGYEIIPMFSFLIQSTYHMCRSPGFLGSWRQKSWRMERTCRWDKGSLCAWRELCCATQRSVCLPGIISGSHCVGLKSDRVDYIWRRVYFYWRESKPANIKPATNSTLYYDFGYLGFRKKFKSNKVLNAVYGVWCMASLNSLLPSLHDNDNKY